jgi:hypothetical protein
MQVTTSNKKSTECRLICNTTKLFMSDATADFRTLAITPRAERAFVFPCADAAEHGRAFLRSLYPTFDWQAVPVKG